MLSKLEINQLVFEIVSAAIEVHKIVGPTALESIYERCLLYELSLRHINAVNQIEVPIIYKGMELGNALKLDILVEDTIILELKTVESLLPVHEVQLISYMQHTQKPKGLLINFKTAKLVDGVKSFVNKWFSSLPK